MAFVLQRPFAITATLRQVAPKPAQSFASRALHSTPRKQHPNFFTPKIPTVAPASNALRFRTTFRRSYQQATSNPLAQGDVRQRLLYGAGIFGATLFGINMIFNRETREDGA